MSDKKPFKNLAQRKITPDLIHRQRTAIVSLSLVLLIYALAGGSMESHATLLNLPIRFSRPSVLLLAAWVIWAYFLYRYLLVAESPKNEFFEEIQLRVYRNPRVQAICLQALPRFDIPENYREDASKQLTEGWVFAISKREGGYHFDPSRIYFPERQGTPAGAGGQQGYFPLTKSESLTYKLALIPAAVKAIALEMTFSDQVLPYALVLITPAVWLVIYWSAIWQTVCGWMLG